MKGPGVVMRGWGRDEWAGVLIEGRARQKKFIYNENPVSKNKNYLSYHNES